MSEKVLVVGLDGATWDVLRPGMEAGYLPNLRTLYDEHVAGNLESTYPPITPVAWSSFLTGCNPGKHGIQGFSRRVKKDNGYETEINDSTDIQTVTLWELLSRRGKSVVSLNLPMTYPPFEVDGVLVSGLFTPSARADFTHPPELQEELLEQDYSPIIKHVAGDLPKCSSKAEYCEKVDEIADLVEKKFEQAYYVDGQYDWDVFFMQLQEIDVIQHFLIGFYEEGHEWYDPEMMEYVFENFYGQIDKKLGELLENLGEDALTLVISDHGFQTSDRTVYLGNFLAEEGFAVPNRKGDLARRLINGLKSLDVLGLRRHVPHAKKIRKDKESMVFDWEESDAICLGGGYVPTAPIYVTAKRNEREAVIEQLVDRFRTLRDPKTGDKIVTDVIRGDDVYAGEQTEAMPDLLVSSETHAFRTALHPEKPTVVDMLEFTNRPGIHAQEGVLLANGAGVQSGGERVNGRLRDIASTILYYLDESIPSYMDGAVLDDLFTDKFNDTREERRVDIPSDRDNFAFHSSEEEEQVKETLSKLGYVD